MAVFYLLPSRDELARQWARYFRQWFPGLHEPATDFVDTIAEIVAPQPGVYVVFADDLPVDGHVWEALEDGFGASPGDRVIDVRSSPRRMAA
ncbi:MAG TPA: hypothetical protein VH120_08410 [Gemmataceae bacterium]|jgi:hypothetical protein|nr:hypothetical protein [Gemmataceae bacterium]